MDTSPKAQYDKIECFCILKCLSFWALAKNPKKFSRYALNLWILHFATQSSVWQNPCHYYKDFVILSLLQKGEKSTPLTAHLPKKNSKTPTKPKNPQTQNPQKIPHLIHTYLHLTFTYFTLINALTHKFSYKFLKFLS